MIPKILHLYWGHKPMSWLQTLTVTTFHRQNPDWEIRLYKPMQENTNDAKWIPDYTGKDYLPEVEKLPYVKTSKIDLTHYGIDKKLHNIQRSDIFRAIVLCKLGGIWSDFDVLWIRPITELLKVRTLGKVITSEMGTSVCYESTKGHHSTGVIIARQKHPMYSQLVKICMTRQNKDAELLGHQTFGPDLWDELWPDFASCVKQYRDAVCFPYKTFYPYRCYHLDELYKNVNIECLYDPEVIAIHWFNGYEGSKSFVNQSENRQKDCSMKRIINLIKEEII